MSDPCRHDVGRVTVIQPFGLAAGPHILKQLRPGNQPRLVKDRLERLVEIRIGG
ncbi:MAG: hypothetical protein ABGZ53_22395 [Fuerstiella sp.]